MIKAILLSSLLFNIGLLLGRFSGFIRESFLAASFGVSAEADIAVMMLSIPDLLVNILVGGGLAAALVPEFTQFPSQARRLWWQSMLIFTGFFMLIAALLHGLMQPLMALLAPGFSNEQLQASLLPMRWVIWLMPLTVLTGVVAAYLQANNRFGAAAMGTLVINSIIVLGLCIIIYFGGSLLTLALFVLLGGFVRWLIQFISAVRISGLPQFDWQPWHINGELFVRFLQVASAGSVLLCFPVVVRAVASYHGDGAVAQVSFALKLIELPLALTVTFLATVLFPRLSKAFQQDQELFGTLVVWGARLTLFLSLLALAVVAPLAPVLTQLVYGYGSMTPAAVQDIAQLLQQGALYIPFMGLATFIAVVFNARKETLVPLVINLVALGVLLAGLLIWKPATLAQLMQALIVAYVFAGVGLLCVFLYRNVSLISKVLDWRYWMLMIGLPISVFQVLEWVSTQAVSGLFQLLIAAVVAGCTSIFAMLLIPTVRNLLVGKLKPK